MWAVLATIEFVTFGVFTGFLVHYYAAKGSPLYSLVLVYISWYVKRTKHKNFFLFLNNVNFFLKND